MRRLTTVLFGVLFSIGFAASATALSVDPNPLSFTSGRTEGSISFGVTGSTVTMELSVDKGKVSRVKITTADSGGDKRQAIDAGSTRGDGVNIRRVRILGDGSVMFFFKSSFFHQHIHAGQTSDPFYVTYASLAAGDTITMTGYRHVIFGSFGSATATIIPDVPEPSAAILVGLGIVGLAVAGRRRG
jgi:hypothetical protein